MIFSYMWGWCKPERASQTKEMKDEKSMVSGHDENWKTALWVKMVVPKN